MFKLGVQVGVELSSMSNFFQSILRQSSGYVGHNKYRNTEGRQTNRTFNSENEDSNGSYKNSMGRKKDSSWNGHRNPDQHSGRASYDTQGAKRNKNKHHFHDAERTPNLLTWDEKQQMRRLNEESPQDWSPDRLAGTFPASVSTVKNILSNRWKPNDIERHDAAVARNWKLLKNGQIDTLEPSLKLHLSKFLPSEKKQEISRTQHKISKYENGQHDDSSVPETVTNQETFVHNMQEEDVSLAIVNDVFKNKEKAIAKFATKKAAVMEQKPLYPEKITIPEDKWKEGATYKVGDVYYHSDGTFLYRVPGITQ